MIANCLSLSRVTTHTYFLGDLGIYFNAPGDDTHYSCLS